MSKFTGYRCSICKTEYLPGQVNYTCPQDGGNLDVVLDYEGIREKYESEDITSRADTSLWRYAPLLPVPEVEGDGTPLHAAGWTPVFKMPVLAGKLGLQNLWLKTSLVTRPLPSRTVPAPSWWRARGRSRPK